MDSELAERLLAAAALAATRAYAPYSKFPVGAAVLTGDGTIISGCNVENASYGLTCCAERIAIFSTVAAGHREIRAIAVVAPAIAEVTPCGACRQVLQEFVPTDGDLLVVTGKPGQLTTTTLRELLPRAFGQRDLS